MRGPKPKNPALRQRRNRTATAATLSTVEEAAKNTVPELPVRSGHIPWHPRVEIWWGHAWTSPMAEQWLASDVSGVMYRVAELNQDFWMATDPGLRTRIDARISALETELGLTPIARRRLQWEVEKGEQASDRTARRRQSKRLDEVANGDPRQSLKVVS